MTFDTSDDTCPQCNCTDTTRHPGQRGFGQHIRCADCGFPIDYR